MSPKMALFDRSWHRSMPAAIEVSPHLANKVATRLTPIPTCGHSPRLIGIEERVLSGQGHIWKGRKRIGTLASSGRSEKNRTEGGNDANTPWDQWCRARVDCMRLGANR